MMLTEPIDFEAAKKIISDKTVVPSGLTSAQQQALPAQFNIRGMFSAQTLNGQLLSGYQDQLKEMTAGQVNDATARLKIKDLIDELGIEPPSEEEAGTLTDLGSNSRIGLVLGTNLQMARGKGQYDQGMSEGARAAYPALELIRVEERMVPRDWFDIWDAAADELGDATTATDADETGRMVAVKGDPIWLAISDFGQPYPPFKFNSGMGIEDVDREDAIDLGVIDEDEIPEAAEMGFNDDVESSVAEIAPELLDVLEQSLQGIATLVGDAFRMVTGQPKPIGNRAAHVLELLEDFA